jgi:Basic region leucine zipper
MADVSSEAILSMLPSIGPVSSLLTPEMLSTMTMTSVSDVELNGILDEIGFFDEDYEETFMLSIPDVGTGTPRSATPSTPMSSDDPPLTRTVSSGAGLGAASSVDDESSFVPVSPERRGTESPSPPSSYPYCSPSYLTSGSNTLIAPKPNMGSSTASVVSMSSTCGGGPGPSYSATTSPVNYRYTTTTTNHQHHHPPAPQRGTVSPTEPSMRAVFNPLQVPLPNFPPQPSVLHHSSSMPATAALAAALKAASSSSSSSASSSINNGHATSTTATATLAPMIWPSLSQSSLPTPTTTTGIQHQVAAAAPRKRKLDSVSSNSTSSSSTNDGMGSLAAGNNGGCSNETLSSLTGPRGCAGDEKFLSEDDLEARRYVGSDWSSSRRDDANGEARMGTLFLTLSINLLFLDHLAMMMMNDDLVFVCRERNRIHAKKSRLRKKGVTETLQDALLALREENEKLRELIHAKIGKKVTEDLLEKRCLESHAKFISALTTGGGGANNGGQDNGGGSRFVVDAKTVSFLRGLRKNVPSVSSTTPPSRVVKGSRKTTGDA